MEKIRKWITRSVVGSAPQAQHHPDDVLTLVGHQQFRSRLMDPGSQVLEVARTNSPSYGIGGLPEREGLVLLVKLRRSNHNHDTTVATLTVHSPWLMN